MSANPIIFCIQDLYLCADIKELENKNIFFIAQYCLNLMRVYDCIYAYMCEDRDCVFEYMGTRLKGYRAYCIATNIIQAELTLNFEEKNIHTYLYVRSFCYSFSVQAILVCNVDIGRSGLVVL
jgi:hypothetical protein